MQRPQPPTPQPAPTRRGAFTLVELLVVIVVIAILLSLVLPALFSVQSRARVAQVVVEIKNLEKAIADFKLKYGVEPPSRFRIRGDGAYDPQGNQTDRESLAIMRQIWPNYNPVDNPPGDLTGNGNPDTFTLSGAECLVFFLGGPGVFQAVSPFANGFSPNPANPFSSGGNRVGPFFDFDPARLVDVDGDGAPEYLDPLPGQTRPYVYASSYEGRGYNRATDSNDNPINPDLIIGSEGESLRSEYLRPGETASINPNSFQIISPGFDGNYVQPGAEWGNRGGPYDRETRLSAARAGERDNITNFAGGELNP